MTVRIILAMCWEAPNSGSLNEATVSLKPDNPSRKGRHIFGPFRAGKSIPKIGGDLGNKKAQAPLF